MAGRLPGVVTGGVAPPLPDPAPIEAIAADLWSLGVTPEAPPSSWSGPVLDALGVVPAVGGWWGRATDGSPWPGW